MHAQQQHHVLSRFMQIDIGLLTALEQDRIRKTGRVLETAIPDALFSLSHQPRDRVRRPAPQS
jgi:hypothetical protein